MRRDCKLGLGGFQAQKQEVRNETADPDMSNVQAGTHSREDRDRVHPGAGLQEVRRPPGHG